MQKLFIILAIELFSTFGYPNIEYEVKSAALNTCDCATTSVTESYKIKPGKCILSLSGRIEDGQSTTFLEGHIAIVSEKIFNILRDCKHNVGNVRIVYWERNPVPEIIEIYK